MAGLIDIHQHIVYGVDDGPRTIEDSYRMLLADKANGITDVIATSHAAPAMEAFPLERYERHLSELNRLSRERGLGVNVYTGCEVFYAANAADKLARRCLPTLAGSRFTLIEFDPTSAFETMENAIRHLANEGFIPIIAHCERYGAMVDDPRATAALRQRYRMRLQINANTFLAKPPRPIRKFCEALMREDALDYVATDAHGVQLRPPNLREAYRVLEAKRDADSAMRWVCENQLEIWSEECRLG